MKKVLSCICLSLLALPLTCCDGVLKGDYANESCIFSFLNRETNQTENDGEHTSYLTKDSLRTYYDYFYLIEHDFLGYWELQFKRNEETKMNGIQYTDDYFTDQVREFKYDIYYMEFYSFDENDKIVEHYIVDKRK